MTRALIVVDVQNDFCEGGSLPVAGGARVARDVSEAMAGYEVVVATKDHHHDPGDHWSEQPDFVSSWPVHCKVGTSGEEFHPDLDTTRVQEVFRKGAHEAAYSGFEGVNEAGTRLADWLRARSITAVDVCGLATDHCVRATALDAARLGFETAVLTRLSAGVAPETTARALEELREAGVEIS